jgi:hypothetical protein
MSIGEIENMIPFEREVWTDFIREKIESKKNKDRTEIADQF